ncbi:MAG: response regulator transcription factor [Bacteroidales bacterium]|nr:response regulator transcription factor [Bacteroidales bacterium]MBN2758776.1 response regulator transcription factor [Bacteroidales bacterium]
MNCIVIDDDKVSRLLIEKYVNKTDFLEFKGAYNNAVDALNTMQSENDIDLIFLDIEMPEMSGVEFIKTLTNLPQIIVISAKDKYALEAIEYDVADYLLKPISFTRFVKAVEKVHAKFKEAQEQLTGKDGIFIKSSSSSLVRLKYEDILWIEALENYVIINTFTNKFTIHFTMKAIINKLPLKMFSRVHRSYIVNLTKIEMIEDNAIVMKIKGETKSIPIAKSYKEDLMNNINIMTK